MPDATAEELAHPDFNAYGYESLGTVYPACSSRYGGQTSGADHDHVCEQDADPEDPDGRCIDVVMGIRNDDGTYPPPFKQRKPHQCACGFWWETNATSTAIAGYTIQS